MNKITKRYWRNSMRLRNWDYGSEGAYFITICTFEKEHFFGEVHQGKMHLNEAGRIAEQIWLLIPEQFSYVRMGSFVIMPNHVHGILIINKSLVSEDSDNIPVKVLAGKKGPLAPSIVAARLIAPPPIGGSQLPPPIGGNQLLPPIGGSQLPPPIGGNQLPPPIGGSQLPPPIGGNQLPPPIGGSQLLPPIGGNQLLPPIGGSQLPPPIGGNQLPPPIGGNQLPPPIGGNQLPPPIGGNQLPPPIGDNELPLQTRENQMPPQRGENELSDQARTSGQGPLLSVTEHNMSSLKSSSLLFTKEMKPRTGGFAGELNPMLNDNISRVIRWYKGRCSFEIRKTQRDFRWQSKFHDHIIRNEISYYCIEMYIEENPMKWSADELKRIR